MGQAFDHTDALLGEHYAQTKREVFDNLSERFPDAERLEIRTMRDETAKAGPLGGTLAGINRASSQDQCSAASSPSPESLEQYAKRTQARLVVAQSEYEKARINAEAGQALVSPSAQRLDEAARVHENAVRQLLQSLGLTSIR